MPNPTAPPPVGAARTVRRLVLAVVVALLGGLGVAATAGAYDITAFTGTVVRPDGTTYADLAGEHPDGGIVDFTFATDGSGEPVGNTKDVRVDIPPGLVPNPEAFTRCTDAQLSAKSCPVGSQIGKQELTVRATIPTLALLLQPTRQTLKLQVPLYNMTIGADQVARFAFNPAMAPASGQANGDKSPIQIIGGVRDTTDAGLFFTISNLPTNPAVVRSKLTFWGTPGLTSHDAERGKSCTNSDNGIVQGAINTAHLLEAGIAGPCSPGGQPLPVKDTPFLTNPTRCAGPLTTRLTTWSYAGEQRNASFDTPYGALDCAGVPFAPTAVFGPGNVGNDAPMPLTVGLRVPQATSSSVRGSAHLDRVAVTLPPGTTISPSAANGLQTCSDAQFGRGTHNPIACPAASKVGTARIATPLLPDPLVGTLYVGDPKPGDRYRLLLVVDGHGVTLRLVGSIQPDPATGQVTAIFDHNPQLPFTAFDLSFDGGPRAIVASPQACGSATGNVRYGGWSGATVDAPAGFQVGGCGGDAFAPTLSAAAGSSKSGAYAPLTVGFGRPDGQQFLSRVRVDLPPGLLAKIKGVPRCGGAQIAQQACPEASRIGTASVQAGPGPAPYPLSGPVYLTDGYRGQAFGMVTMIRAIAGPYDLGTVVVRQSIGIDPNDAHVVVESDPLPQVVEGIPLRLRQLQLGIDRPKFVRNPTSCGTAKVRAALGSIDGTAAQGSSDLAFEGCKSLAFKPKVSLRFTGRKQAKRLQHTGVTAIVTQKEGEAGIRSTSVALPTAVSLAAANAKKLCEYADAQRDACPRDSIIGTAIAETPILEKKLRGPVYFVKGIRTDPKTGRQIKTLPHLFAPLRGQATIYVRAMSAISRNRLVTTFPSLPDAPITKFTLVINGGKHGIIANTRNLCRSGKLRGSARLEGYNGAKRSSRPLIGLPCKKVRKR
ncbi:hypothetical protein [Patulibacter medicamentivorans]|uniref:hypothetical protein n=1 Tax=Patulibacter medicamentivorans TaxID=1097667 RepID=UPI001110626D|nr:hypothetical protein [Patulibacter medicamentivorans]